MRHARSNALGLLGVGLLLSGALLPSPSSAESWCAAPVWVHEWGVHTFGAAGSRGGVGPSLPAYFHGQPSRPQAVGPAVRTLPPDSGERSLPVVHFYAPPTWDPVPIGFEVGFARGMASRWYPQLDAVTPAAQANAPASRSARGQLLTARAARAPGMGGPPLGRDPTRQLHWDALSLTRRPTHRRVATSAPWVRRARGFGQALWVNNAHESERFLFYEGETRETPALRLERGPSYAPGRHHYLLHNVGEDDAHDVFFVRREGSRRYVFFVPRIPASRSAGFLLEDHAVEASAFDGATRAALRDRLVDSAQPASPRRYRWTDCPMMRDPAIPVEAGDGHRLYAHEIDAIIDVWGARFFDAPGTTITYREPTSALDREMPISVYTDMHHVVELRRLGLAVIENVAP